MPPSPRLEFIIVGKSRSGLQATSHITSTAKRRDQLACCVLAVCTHLVSSPLTQFRTLCLGNSAVHSGRGLAKSFNLVETVFHGHIHNPTNRYSLTEIISSQETLRCFMLTINANQHNHHAPKRETGTPDTGSRVVAEAQKQRGKEDDTLDMAFYIK